MNDRAVFVLESYSVLVQRTVHHGGIGCHTCHSRNFRIPTYKRIGVLGRVGRGLAFGGHRHRTILHFRRGLGTVTVHKGDSVLVLGRRVGGRVGGVTRNIGNLGIPAAKLIGVFSSSGLFGSPRLYDIARSGTIGVRSRGQGRAIIIHKRYSVQVHCFVHHRSVGCIASDSNNFRSPTRKGIGVLGIVGGSLARRRDRHFAIFHLATARCTITIHEGHGVLVFGRFELGRVILISRNGDNFRIPTVKCVSVSGIRILGGRRTGIYRYCSVGHRLRSQHCSVIQEPDGVVICHLIKDSLICCISCRCSQRRFPSAKRIGVLGRCCLCRFCPGILRNRTLFHFYRLQCDIAVLEGNGKCDRHDVGRKGEIGNSYRFPTATGHTKSKRQVLRSIGGKGTGNMSRIATCHRRNIVAIAPDNHRHIHFLAT